MMIRNSRTRRAFVATTLASLGAAAFVRSPAKAAPFEIKCGSDFAIDHPSTIRLGQMWSAIQRESGGRIHVEFFPNNALGGTAAVISQVRLGAIAAFFTSPGNWAPIVPATDIVYLGFAYKDVDEGFRVMDGALGGYLRNELTAKGAHPMRTFWNSGMFEISSSTRPIRVPDDFHGFKIRVGPSKVLVDLFKSLGASPTSMGLSEIYTSLQTKLIDGTATPLLTLETSRLYEVQKYISMTNHAWNCLALFINKGVWDSMPADLQDIVERNNTKYAMLERADTKALDNTTASKLASQGLIFNRVDQGPFRASLRTYFQGAAELFGPTEWGLLESSLGHKLA